MRSELDLLCEKMRVRIDCTDGDYNPDWPEATAWKCTLRFQGRRLTVPFYQGPAHCKEPTAADVLYCLCSDARAGEQSFEDFCADFGYDTDSRKAEKTWEACEAMGPKLRRLLGYHFEAFANAEH